MLKLTYTETGFHLERLMQSPEQLVALRVMLAMRVGESIVVEPSSAAFLLPVKLSALDLLEAEVQGSDLEQIVITTADADYVEVSLNGTWINQGDDEEYGIFITTLSDRVEFLLAKLWNEVGCRV